MEAAAGESFRSIIQRIWTTLNGGIPLDSTTDPRLLPWPVVAFAVACYFHRNYVLCPEPLLREFLLNTLIEAPPSYLTQELQQLVTREEGWHIFSVQTAAAGQASSIRLIGSTHARVAREAWSHSPLRGLNVEKTVVDVSSQAPQAAPQLAELILALQSSSMTSERRLANRFAVRWNHAVERGTVETRAVCALVRQLKPSRPARLQFRPVLRKCLTAQDSQSWLAAWQLYHMASAELHPQEREFLLKVNLPWTLKIADLSKGPREAIEIATRLGNDTRSTVIERLVDSLRGELDWRVNAEQVAWLINNLPYQEVASLLEFIYSWLENGLLIEPEADRASDAYAVDALVGFLGATTELDTATKEHLLRSVFDWLLTSPETNHQVMLRTLKIAESSATSRDSSAAIVLTQMLDLLRQRPESNEGIWTALLELVGRLPGLAEQAEQIARETFEWLRSRPESNEGTWLALLALVRQSPGLAEQAEQIARETFEWLRSRPESNEGAWLALLALVRQSPGLAEQAEQIARETFEWLRSRPESNEGTWTALLALVRQSPGLAEQAEQIARETFEWLRSRPESNEGAWLALLALVRQSPALAEQIVAPTLEWLRSRPESNEGTWTALLALVRQSPGLAEQAEQIARETFEWLRSRPESNEGTWTALLALVRQSPALAEQIVAPTLEWLRSRPESNEGTWTALLALVRQSPGLAEQAEQIARETFEWLRSRPESNESTWTALLALVRQSPALAEQIVAPTLEWLRSRPESNEGIWLALLELVGRLPGPGRAG